MKKFAKALQEVSKLSSTFHLPPSSAVVKNVWSCTSTHPMFLHCVNRDSFLLCVNFSSLYLFWSFPHRAFSQSTTSSVGTKISDCLYIYIHSLSLSIYLYSFSLCLYIYVHSLSLSLYVYSFSLCLYIYVHSLSLSLSLYIYVHSLYIYTGLFISPSGISELDRATAKTDTAERSIWIGREALPSFFFLY